MDIPNLSDPTNPIKRRRVQLTAEEKIYFKEQLKRDPSFKNAKELISEWNSRPGQAKQINKKHMKRLWTSLRLTYDAESFAASVDDSLKYYLARHDAKKSFELPADGCDYTGYKTKRINPDKIPWIDKTQLDQLRFPFDAPKYNRSENPAKSKASRTFMRRQFREHWDLRGLVLGRLSDFANPDDRAELDRKHGKDKWVPSADGDGPWERVRDVLLTNKKVLNAVQKLKVFSDAHEMEVLPNPPTAVQNVSDPLVWIGRIESTRASKPSSPFSCPPVPDRVRQTL
jgi:hypothetical protein